MNYQEASHTRKKSLLALIAEKKYKDELGLGESIGSAISQKFKARSVGIKEKFDPLNIVRKLTGKGIFGDVATTIAGRALRRSNEDIGYFGGFRRKTKNKKDPRYTNISAGPIKALRSGDSMSDILGKMYNLIVKVNDSYEQNYEIERLFRKEQLDEDDRRHKELVKAIRNYTKNKKTYTVNKSTKDNDGDSGFFKSFFDMISKWGKTLIAALEGIIPAIGAYLLAKLGLGRLNPSNKGTGTTGPQNSQTNQTGSRPVIPMGTPGGMAGRGGSVKSGGTPAASRKAGAKESSTARKELRERGKQSFGDTGKSTKVNIKAGALKGVTGLMKFLSSVPGLSTLINAGILESEIRKSQSRFDKGEIDEKQMKREIQIAVGGALGSISGATLGALLGSPLAAVGGPLVLGTAGGWAGGYAGEKLADFLMNYFEKNGDDVTGRKLQEIANMPVPPGVFGQGAATVNMQGIKKKEIVPKTVPELKKMDTNDNNSSNEVSVNNTNNNVGGTPPKVVNTASVKIRNDDLRRYNYNNAQVV